jgi:uncharacterized protein (TIGR03083 family)
VADGQNQPVDVFPLIAAERIRLADTLDGLSADDWAAPSLCTGWSVHVVAAHLNAPWEATFPNVLVEVAKARSLAGGFDRLARRLAGSLDPAACVAGLRDHAGSRFTPPGFGPEAPLSDVIVHGADMLQPLGRSVAIDPVALATSLEFLARGRSKGFVPKGRIDGLAFEASDLDVRCGPGNTVVRGPALALCATLCGRRAFLDQLSGDGLAVLASRL